MARIDAHYFERREKITPSTHKVAFTSYCFPVCDGEKFFQIDMYGSPDREFQEKISQTIQFDKVMAKKLIDILKKEYSIS
jgi:hypothetical protein